MRVRHPSFTLALASAFLLLPACDGTRAESGTTAGGPVGFDEARAFADLRYLCDTIGPRRIATPGAEKTRAYLRQQLEPLGWTIEESKFEAVAPEGAQRQGSFTGVNVLARRAGTIAGEIWLAGHYDTYDKPGFVGANDGGSSTALLLELGRQLGGQGPRAGMSLVLAFFDGEEKFPPLAWNDDTNSTFGSRFEAARIKAAKREKEVRALLLFDMIGDADLGITIESSTDSTIRKLFEKTAYALNDKQLFVGAREIKDDHIHFRKLGIPVSDLIDFNFGPNNAYWHELEDKVEHVSAASLGRVGRLTLTALPELEKTYAAERR